MFNNFVHEFIQNLGGEGIYLLGLVLGTERSKINETVPAVKDFTFQWRV